MTQVSQFLAGERDYSLIKGGTGPLVYPAGHVYVYTALFKITNGGNDVFAAQVIFTALYLTTLALVMACYRRAEAPPYIFGLLILSKRLHSIYILRLFNDCWAMFFAFAAIYALQRKAWTIGSVLYSLALSIKMNVLLLLPALGMILLQALGRDRAIRQAIIIAQIQVVLALPFTLSGFARSYLAGAFEFTRAFFYKWTVNWRSVSAETFLSKGFSRSLLIGHVLTLLVFMSTRWNAPSGRSLTDLIVSVFERGPAVQLREARARAGVTPQFVLTTMFGANVIGILFARSLHYQFYSWFAWMTPFLLWRSGMHPLLLITTWAAQEWAWDVYPSTSTSSMVVVGILLLQVVRAWVGSGEDQMEALRRRSREEHDTVTAKKGK
ncbi:hypothetical protein G7K_0577-t1 [Saitoella complicata NRRL Y-17804]|uniref:Dol-P-Man:Man(5)GlcNAc(2)-PP-Dol alpha-1,3-mannosyltransferase n=2 Tax=Saitoella complicata (strain BCRC 22490 / CBS 7301 / JCM 7358 / NBRC 10748 / NRRL Y-17804) TaxID=698492 RepID=A0A0E9NAB5_SAICN|nr:hypothetical protein G7K_0577-t1 [Saitoella complicata NRRL Y-17804]